VNSGCDEGGFGFVGTGRGRFQILQGWGGDSNSIYGDGTGTEKVYVGYCRSVGIGWGWETINNWDPGIF